MIIVGIEIIALTVVGFFLGYLALLSVLALTVKIRSEFPVAHRRIFAVVIPAHNEELVIENTLKSLFALEYRSELFEIIVIADNCTDRTAEIARSLGAIVYERTDKINKGKGRALRWCFEKLLNSSFDYDAFVVVDADSVVSKNFLEVMNFYLERKAQVVQASDLVQPQPGAWSPEVTRIALALYNYVRPLGRKVLGCSAGLRGNGMCFSVDVLRAIPWEAYSITEDLEYGLTLLLHGVPAVFAPEATLYAKMPVKAKHAESQRARWEMGRMPLIRRYGIQLLREAMRKRSFPLLDAYIDLVTPAFVNMLVVSFGMLTMTSLLSLVGVGGAQQFIFPWSMVVLAGMVHVLTGLVAVDADRAMYKALLYFPRYAVWKLLLYVKLLVYGLPEEWIRTYRERLKYHALIHKARQ
ncbi:MAG: glycosyltransferase family 2 protein [Ignavibacteriales bacterium]|nr:glycosyltransferase family 2 protein [Ignavibacteriales bacterium]